MIGELLYRISTYFIYGSRSIYWFACPFKYSLLFFNFLFFRFSFLRCLFARFFYFIYFFNYFLIFFLSFFLIFLMLISLVYSSYSSWIGLGVLSTSSFCYINLFKLCTITLIFYWKAAFIFKSVSMILLVNSCCIWKFKTFSSFFSDYSTSSFFRIRYFISTMDRSTLIVLSVSIISIRQE